MTWALRPVVLMWYVNVATPLTTSTICGTRNRLSNDGNSDSSLNGLRAGVSRASIACQPGGKYGVAATAAATAGVLGVEGVADAVPVDAPNAIAGMPDMAQLGRGGKMVVERIGK